MKNIRLYMQIIGNSGGFHAKNYWSCLAVTIIFSIAIPFLFINIADTPMVNIYSIMITSIITFLIILIFTPIETENKPVKDTKKKKEKQNSRTCDLCNIHSYIYSYYLPWYQQFTKILFAYIYSTNCISIIVSIFVRTLSDLSQKKQYQLSYHFLF